MTPATALQLAILANGTPEELAAGLPTDFQNATWIGWRGTQCFIADLEYGAVVIAFAPGRLEAVWAEIHLEIARREPDAIYLVGPETMTADCEALFAGINQPDVYVV